MQARPLSALLVLATLAGCLSSGGDGDDAPNVPGIPILGPVLNATPTALMSFTEAVVTAAVDATGDLYEPTMEVSATGVIYITGHTIAVDTTGAPVFMSKDEGKTWKQLPFAGPVAAPSPVQGATPPPSDEIFLMAGDDGWLYGVDITLATYPVNAWSDDGANFAYHNPNAYDEAQVALQTNEGCVPAPAKDRPWGAYANGSLLMVSNPAAGPVQIGVLQVPPLLPAGIGATVGGASWNLCAGPGGQPTDCSIPGIPDLREDGAIAVPQRCEGKLYLVTGNVEDIMATSLVEVFDHTSGSEITSVYGIAAFDGDGTLFVGISNNTRPDGNNTRQGGLLFALSDDAGSSFATRTFTVETQSAVRHFYMDPNDFGAGALVVWAVNGTSATTFDWYVGHLQRGPDGGPVLENVALAIDEGPRPSAHVTGAAVGPDGRAYIAMYRGVEGPPGSTGTPLSVFIQQDGPTLPLRHA